MVNLLFVLKNICIYWLNFVVTTGLLGAIFGELNDADVIPQETFIAWRDSKDQSAGKGKY